MNLLFIEGFQRILIVLILVSIVIAISRRNLISLINTFAIQSLVLSVLVLLIYLEERNLNLVYLCTLTFASKCILIPFFLKKTRKSMNIYVDLQYNMFTPTASIFSSLILFSMLFFSLSFIKDQLEITSLNYVGIVVGLSLLFIGMLMIIGRKKIISKIIGYLMMENGVVLMSIFLGDLPFLIEALIFMDLLMLLAISSILGFGMDSSVEEFHAKLNPFRNWLKKVNKEW